MTCKPLIRFSALTESHFTFRRMLSLLLICSCTFVASAASKNAALDSNTKDNDAKLLDDYIAASGPNSKLLFDASNIKQYWIDYSVISNKDNFTISTKRIDSKIIISAICASDE